MVCFVLLGDTLDSFEENKIDVLALCLFQKDVLMTRD